MHSKHIGADISGFRLLRVITGLVTAVAVVVGTWMVGEPVHADTTSQAGASLSATLLRPYLAARGLYPTSVSDVRIQRILTVNGVTWAAAEFVPSAVAPLTVAARFQDGAGMAVFESSPGHAWRLVHIGPYACAPEVPAAMRGDWNVAGCRLSPQEQRVGALAARARLGTARTMGERIARIALSQVGVADIPVARDFRVDCDPYTTMVGATSANGNGCGSDTGFGVVDENEPWCADFTKWVWQQAGVTTGMTTLDAGAGSFYTWARRQGRSPRPDTGTPVVGDAVVFLPPGPITDTTTYGDHVGTVTGVNPDGTINMVNGDFLGTDNISTQYNTDIDLTTFASRQWVPGEQWVLITPPDTVQPRTPVADLAAPAVVAAGTSARFDAVKSNELGTVREYRWTFGDGRTTNTTGAHVTHSYAGIGPHPVTLTTISNAGTVDTRTRVVDVVGSSSTVAAEPNREIWYRTTPVLRTFAPPPAADGIVTVLTNDGDRWRRATLPVRAAGATTTTLVYPDRDDVPTTHEYYRDTNGQLSEVVTHDGRWITHALAGAPAGDSALVAGTHLDGRAPGANSGETPVVYFFDSAGRLVRATSLGHVWTADVLPVATTGDHSTLALVDSVTATAATTTRLVYRDRFGGLTVVTDSPRGRQQSWIWSPYGVAAHSPITAVDTGAGRIAVYFLDGRGHLAQTTSSGNNWQVTELPVAPVAGAGLTAVTAATAKVEVFYRDASGPMMASFTDGPNWRFTALPHPSGPHGSSLKILGASSYPLPGQPDEVMLSNVSAGGTQQFILAERADPGAGWSVSSQ